MATNNLNKTLENNHELAVAPELQRDIEMAVPASWTAQLKAAKEIGQMFAAPIADTEALKAIEIRAEQRAGGLSIVGSDKQMAEADVADFQNISEESGLQRFAAVQITDNINDYPDYKTSFENAASQYPGLSEKVAEFYVLDNAMAAAKEERKAAESQSMTQDAQSVSKTPGAPVVESESQLDIDKAMLRAIELHGESISAETEPGNAEKHRSAAVADVSDFQKISDPNYQRFAADQIGNNCYDSGAYKAAFEVIAANHPGLAEKVTAMVAVENTMIAAKEDRKALDMSQLGIESTVVASNPELIPTYRPPTEEEAKSWAAINAANPENVAPELVIDAATLERMASNRARDSAAARQTLNLNSVEPNLEKEQKQMAGEDEVKRSAWLKNVKPTEVVKPSSPNNQVESDEMFTTEKSAAVKPVIPPEIESQYLRTGDKFYHPKTPELVAFEDKGHKLETKSDSENISQNLVKIAQARGWDEIKISGSEKFRQEVWLEASTRGMEVKGYTPTDLDKAQLAKRVSEIGANKIEKANIPFRGRENEALATKAETAKPDSENKRMADTFAKESSVDALKKYPQLAGAVAIASAIDKQAEAAGLTPEQRAIGAARVRQNLTNSIERGDIPPPVKMLVPVEVKNEAKEDREFSR
jgi:hypothetical protein